ncbi:hypothetical protein [Vibrio sp. 10N.261.46.A3]|uniref:hypothetical protein n=1 Tax=Vibrio sp. 10N.261.46.A3 TaxID=3229658 RepID=UPI003550FA98
MLKKIKNGLLSASVSASLFTSQWAFAKGADPFAIMKTQAEEGTESLTAVLVPVFIFVLMILVVLRYMEYIDNRKLFFAIGLMVFTSLIDPLVNWLLPS